MKTPRILAFVLAGGKGSRLHPLTMERSKPATPFGARYRLVDFVLSNLVNSEIRSIYMLVQYKSQSLIEHVRTAWVISPLMQHKFVSVVPPQMKAGDDWFQGTADAVHQNINLIEKHRPDLVVVFGADHIYRMDVRQMVDFHRENDADVTVAALPVPLEEATAFGVIDADASGRIQDFQEKPQHPASMPGQPEQAFASMGNYLFNADVLMEALLEAKKRGETDFGAHILPRLLGTHRLFSYDFSTNVIPNLKPHESGDYWRDVGTIDAYFQAHKDLLGENPTLDVFNPHWPIYSSHYQGPVAKILGGRIQNSLFGTSTVIHDNTQIKNSIIRREAVIEEDVELEDCIIMDYVRVCKGARLRRVIVDRHNEIKPGEVIGFDRDADGQRFHVSEGGVTIVPKGRESYFARDPRIGLGSGYA